MGNDKVLLRKYEDDLYVSGTGVMIMGIWSVLKVVMELFFGGDIDFNIDSEELFLRIAVWIIIGIFIAIFMLLILQLHFYIGVNASKAARGLKYKKGFFKAAVFMLVLTVMGLGAYPDKLKDPESIDTTIASILVDITTIYIFVILLISTVKIKKLKEQIRE